MFIKSKLRVLLVEDEPLVSMLVEDMLTNMGHLVAAASRAQEAMTFAKEGEFDLAVLDLNLNGHPSYPVADILIARNVPVVFATGYGARGLRPEYAGTPVLNKPFTTSDLGRVIADIVRRGAPRPA